MPTIQFEIQGKKSPCMVYLRLSVAKGKVFKRKTGRLIDKDLWSTDTHLPKPRKDANTTNLRTELLELQAHIYKMYDSDYASGTTIDGEWLLRHINKFFDRNTMEEAEQLPDRGDLSTWCKEFLKRVTERGNYTNRGRVNIGTVKKYNTIVAKLEAFQSWKGVVYHLRDIDIAFRHEFLTYLTEEERLSQNTAGRYIKFVKTIALDARKNGIEVHPRLDDINGFTVKAPKVTLSFNELENIKSTIFLDEKLQVARDWLVISCFVGQRVSDLFRMEKSMIYDVEGFKIISIEQQKTAKSVEIPIHDEVEAILARYNGGFPPVFLVDSESNKAVYNKFVKEVCRLAGLTELTKGNLLNPDTGRYDTGNYEKYKLVSSHIGRRSFATNFYGEQDYPTPLLMSVTGHSTEKMFLEYIGKKPVQYALLLAKVWAGKKKAALLEEQKSLEQTA